MSRALAEITAHAQKLGLKSLRIVRVAATDLADSFECRNLQQIGFYWRPTDPESGNFLTKPTTSGDRITDAPFYYLGNSISEANATLTTKCEWIKDELALLGAGVPKKAEPSAAPKVIDMYGRRRG